MLWIIGFLTVVLVLDSLILVLLVLVQLPKKEAGLGQAFGAGATDALFGAGSGNALTKMTKYATGIFFALTLMIYVLYNHQARARSRGFATQIQQASTDREAAPGSKRPQAGRHRLGLRAPARRPQDGRRHAPRPERPRRGQQDLAPRHNGERGQSANRQDGSGHGSGSRTACRRSRDGCDAEGGPGAPAVDILPSHWGNPTYNGGTSYLNMDTYAPDVNANRAVACPSGKTPPGESCDEYPMASTHQGASFVGLGDWSTVYVPPSANSSQGGIMTSFSSTYQVIDGDPFFVEAVLSDGSHAW